MGLTIQELPLPRSAVICAILRGGEVVIPRGNVRLEAGDEVLALVDEASAPELAALFGAAGAGAAGAMTGRLPVALVAGPIRLHGASTAPRRRCCGSCRAR